jgi:hypothetical protein
VFVCWSSGESPTAQVGGAWSRRRVLKGRGDRPIIILNLLSDTLTKPPALATINARRSSDDEPALYDSSHAARRAVCRARWSPATTATTAAAAARGTHEHPSFLRKQRWRPLALLVFCLTRYNYASRCPKLGNHGAGNAIAEAVGAWRLMSQEVLSARQE